MNCRHQGFTKCGYHSIIFGLVLILVSCSLYPTLVSSYQNQNQSNSNIKHLEFNNYSKTAKLYINDQTRARITTITPPKITNKTVAYAIICPSNLTETLEPLANWKIKKGVPAKIFTVDGPQGIYSNFTTGDNATKIHDFLTSLHENNSNLEWVLLVGDEDIIPSRQVWVGAGGIHGLDDYYYSDHYYAGLNNSWDQDNDGIYGEQKGDVGWSADLYVGRLPVNNVSEANIVINKIIKYETNPEVGLWMRNATFWSGLLDGPNNVSAYDSYKDNAIKITRKIIPYIPEYMNLNHLYDYNQLEGGNYTTKTDILNHISGKKSFYAGHSFINFAGQAYYTGDELAHYMDDTGMSAAPDGFGSLFSFNDGKYAYNGNKLPFLYLSTCSVNFTEPDDSNLEQLLTAPAGGVIGLIGNSGKSYRGETNNGSSYGNWWLNEHFWRMMFNSTYQVGKTLYELKKRYNIEVIYPNTQKDDFYLKMAVANLVGYNLLGDPELSIWTDIPKYLNFSSSLYYNTTYKLKVSVTNEFGVPVENARVCIYNSESYVYGVTNDSGLVIVDLDPRVTDELEATVTAPNHLPIHEQFSYENQPPVLKKIPDIVLYEDEKKYNALDLSDYVSDRDNTKDQLEILVIDITNTEIGLQIDHLNKIDIIPQANWFGKSVVTISVSDGLMHVEGNFTVTVLPVNDPPRINQISKQIIEVGETFTYKVIVFDIDNDELEYFDNSDLFDIDPDTGEINYKPKDDDVGEHEIFIIVSDGENSSNMNFTLVIEKTPSFFEQYWFPMAVIIGFFVVVFIILVRAKKQSKQEELEKAEAQKQKKIKRDMRTRRRSKK